MKQNKKFAAQLNSGDIIIIFSTQNQSFRSIEGIYKFPQISEELLIDFNSKKKLHADEWYYIDPDETQQKDMFASYYQALDSSGSLNPITIQNYNEIKVLYLIIEEESDSSKKVKKILFSRVFPRYKIEQKKFLRIIENDPTLITQSNSIDITGKIDAFWNGQKLIFKSYSTIKPLFMGIEDFYTIATEQERAQFLNDDFFYFPSGKNMYIGDRNLKNIAYIIREKNIDFSDIKLRKKYKKYAHKYSADINFTNNNQIQIKNNSDLSKAIKVINEHFYTGEVSREMKDAGNI